MVATLLASSLAVTAKRPVVVAYVPNWIDLTSFAQTIDYDKVTHLNVAFENPVDADGNMSFKESDRDLIEAGHRHGVKVLVSMGGGGAPSDKELSDRFTDLLGEAKREGFAKKLAEYVVAHKFDGLDVDLEGPNIDANYGAFIDVLAREMKKRRKLLTAAVSKGYGGDRVPESALKQFDLTNIMAYDGTGTWAPDRPGQHSSMEMAMESADYWIGRGLDRGKAVLGVPFYGYGFGEAFRTYGYTYAEILGQYPGAEALDQIGNTIWYNGIPTIQAKANYVREQRLAGVMIWSLDGDVKDERSLLTALDSALRRKP